MWPTSIQLVKLCAARTPGRSRVAIADFSGKLPRRWGQTCPSHIASLFRKLDRKRHISTVLVVSSTTTTGECTTQRRIVRRQTVWNVRRRLVMCVRLARSRSISSVGRNAVHRGAKEFASDALSVTKRSKIYHITPIQSISLPVQSGILQARSRMTQNPAMSRRWKFSGTF